MCSTMRRVGVAGLAVVLFSGCGGLNRPDVPTTQGAGKVTFYVKDMGKQLNLM